VAAGAVENLHTYYNDFLAVRVNLVSHGGQLDGGGVSCVSRFTLITTEPCFASASFDDAGWYLTCHSSE